MANRIEMSDATKKGIALAIGALCVCVVGAMLAVGRGSGSTGLQAARGGSAPGAASAPGGGRGSRAPSDGLRRASERSFDQFRACLEEQGVTPPERGQQRPHSRTTICALRSRPAGSPSGRSAPVAGGASTRPPALRRRRNGPTTAPADGTF